MRFNARAHRRWIRRVALGLTVAAIFAPAAQAKDSASVPTCSGDPGFCVIQAPADQGIQFAIPPVAVMQVPADQGIQFAIPPATVGAPVAKPTPARGAHLRTSSFPSVPDRAPVVTSEKQAPVLTPQQYAHLPTFAFPVNPADYRPVTVAQPKTVVNRPSGRYLPVPTRAPVATGSIDWGSAATGIAIGACLTLLIGVAITLGRRRGTLAGV